MKSKYSLMVFILVCTTWICAQVPNGMGLDAFSGANNQAYEYGADEILMKAMPGSDKKAEDGIESQFGGNLEKLTLKGNARIFLKKDNVKIFANIIEYEQGTDTVTAINNVRFEQKTEDEDGNLTHLLATCDLATMQISKKRMVLEKDPEILYNENKIAGEKIILYQTPLGEVFMNVLSSPKRKAEGYYIPSDNNPLAETLKEEVAPKKVKKSSRSESIR